MTKLTTKATPFHWSDGCEHSFTELKRQLCSAPLLAYPKFDREFTLYTDASDVGLGVVLSQRDDSGLERVIAYGSRSLTPRERKYATTEKEALATHYGTQYFRLYLLLLPLCWFLSSAVCCWERSDSSLYFWWVILVEIDWQ